MTIEQNLENAGKNYSACAKSIKQNCTNQAQPTSSESELLIGLGIASDWVRRSAALMPIQYSRRIMNRSKRSPAVNEMIRFTMAWTALNALFARPPIMTLLGAKTKGSELDLFLSLLSKTSIPQQTIGKYEITLRTLLARTVQTVVPGHPLGTHISTLQIIQEKFTSTAYRGKGVGKTIQSAIQAGTLSGLDLATIIYAMRNWSVHGGLISSSFRTVPGFKVFMKTILLAIADIHLSVSSVLLSKV